MSFPRSLLAVVLVGALAGLAGLAGCSSSFKNIPGDTNAKALQYLVACQHGTAMFRVDESMSSSDPEIVGYGALIKSVIYMDQGLQGSAEAMYAEIVTNLDDVDNAGDARSRVNKMWNEVKAQRRDAKMPETCP